MRAAALRLASLALPPRCPGCGTIVGDDHRFCATCWSALTFLGPPWCASCARPFDHDRGAGARCGACLADPPVYDGARAAVAYGEVAKTVALRLKYGGRAAFAQTVGRLMVRVLPPDAELLIPVPLHRWRLWGRGYNQAALIADAIGKASRVEVRKDLLVRSRATPTLRDLGRRGRARAVAGAFAVTEGSAIEGCHIVLIDDVFTSGATAAACARVLKRADAARVTVLCWARVLEDVAD